MKVNTRELYERSKFDIRVSKAKVKALISRYLCLCIAAIQFMNVAYNPSKGTGCNSGFLQKC